jgi:hypothetical protein
MNAQEAHEMSMLHSEVTYRDCKKAIEDSAKMGCFTVTISFNSGSWKGNLAAFRGSCEGTQTRLKEEGYMVILSPDRDQPGWMKFIIEW